MLVLLIIRTFVNKHVYLKNKFINFLLSIFFPQVEDLMMMMVDVG